MRRFVRKAVFISLIICVICLVIAIDRRNWHRSPTQAQKPALASSLVERITVPYPRSKYPIYPHSLVPGGVHNIAELRDVLHDKAIADQFPDFDLSQAHLVRLEKDRLAYVSFRKNGKIYWTEKPILLRAGEIIITDGRYSIRAQCGNGISFVPMVPTEGTDLASLEIPDPPVASDPPGFTSTLYPTPPPNIPIGGGPPGPHSPPPGGGVIPPPPCINCSGSPVVIGCVNCDPLPTTPPTTVPDIGDEAIFMAGILLAALIYFKRCFVRG
jgi:hypothetical protein